MLPLLSIEDLSIDFLSGDSTTHALKNVSISVNKGEIVALVGESGSGKSVTSLSILRLLPVPPARFVSGRILFSEDGIESTDLLKTGSKDLQEIRGNKIAMIFQEPMSSLNPVLRCGDQVVEAIRSHKKMTNEAARKEAIRWFEKVQLPNPPEMFNRYPHQLSGGQKQRVMIAMAMCCQPSLLICDEPTTALDVTVQKAILQLIRELQQETGMGVIFITHDLGVVAEIANRTVVMYKGSIVEQNTVDNIFSRPEHPYTKGLLACRPILHRKGERLPVVGDFMKEKTDQIIVQKNELVPVEKIREEGIGSTLLEVRNLSVWFPIRKTIFGHVKEYVKAVDEVSFDIFKGETLGLVGESGCGKTTLGRALLRLVNPTAGTIKYGDVDLTTIGKTAFRNLRKEMQIVFQDPYSSLNPRITIGSAIAEPLQVHGILTTSRARKERVAELLEKVDLPSSCINRYPHEFSGGQRQRIVIARALALNPSFIICDESVSALDVSVQAQVLNLLNDLKKEFGFTVVFISHDLSVVRYISDRIMVMNRGHIEETGPSEKIYNNPESKYTRRLIESIPSIRKFIG